MGIYLNIYIVKLIIITQHRQHTLYVLVLLSNQRQATKKFANKKFTKSGEHVLVNITITKIFFI